MAEAFLRNALDAAVIKSKWHVEEMKLHENPVVLLLTSLSLSKVLPPGSFQLDMWAMTDKEKLDSVPHIHEEGNSLFKQGKIKEATEKYYNAIACLKNLQMKVWEQFSWNLLSSLKLEWGLWRVCVWILNQSAGASWRWKLGAAGPNDHTAAAQLLSVPAASGPVLWSHWALLLPGL